MDAVFFDLYGTLVDIRTDEASEAAWSALRAALAGYGVPYVDNAAVQERFNMLAEPIYGEAIAARGECAEADLLPVFAGLIGCWDAALSRATAQNGMAKNQTDAVGDGSIGERCVDKARALAWTFRRASTSVLRLYLGVMELLARLKAAGLRVVLVSNAQSCYTRPELAMLGLEYAFDRIVISSEVGVCKPSAAIFRHALEAEGIEPARALMVGNDEHSDILGAAGAGISGVYMRTEISPPGDPQASARAVCSLTGPDYAGLLKYLNITWLPLAGAGSRSETEGGQGTARSA
ncbi:HAD family hydrolase [Bifidobacterium breve]|uniref:HAD family hydrolase n=1 Tax=Bifidobacterium breve TaxID=1685 RepID=UPI0032DF2721